MTWKVVTNFIDFEMRDEEVLRKMNAEMSVFRCSTEEELITITKDADAVVAGRHNAFTRNVISHLNKCRLIHRMAAGYENIDVSAATEYGICVANAGDFNSEEVAEHTMTLILACTRKLVRFERAVRQGKWCPEGKSDIQQIFRPMRQVRGSTLGIVGFGNIGRLLVPKAKGFEMRVIVFDPYAPKEVFEKFGVESVSFNQLLAESDYITVHAALSKETRHLMGLEQFRKMKPTAYFINCSRGELVDEQALYTALVNGYIAGAGLDVVERQPGKDECLSLDHPLAKLENIIITPHAAYFSDETDIRQKERAYEHLGQIFHGEWPTWFLNPAVKENYLKRWAVLYNTQDQDV